MKPHSLFVSALLVLFLGLSVNTHATIALPALFSAHAVLQKSDRVPIWGKASPGEDVTVAIAGEKMTTKADASGKWRVTLNLTDKSPGPFELTVEGKSRITVPDVLIGEVWICSGQSNMDWSLSRTLGSAAEIAASANPQLRMFAQEKKTSAEPLDDADGKWVLAGPEDSGRFTAVGYFFGKMLQRELKTPIGLISNSWGGTPVEAWISKEALSSDPDLKTGSEKDVAALKAARVRLSEYTQKFNDWKKKYQREGPPPADPAAFAAPESSTAGWVPVTLPGSLSAVSPPHGGALWIRRNFTLTRAMISGPLFLQPGTLSDFDAFYVNGNKVGEMTPETGGSTTPRMYFAEGKILKEGEMTIAIRLVAPAGPAAVIPPAPSVGLGAGSFNYGADHSAPGTSFAGQWLAKVEYALPPLDPEGKKEYPAPLPASPIEPFTASYLFNGTLKPLSPYAFKGVIWYQGESNAARAAQYAVSFPLMIRDWRNQWDEGDFPFYFCQLPNFGADRNNVAPPDSAWAELRESQTKALALPNTGEAVLIDIGEDGDVHPRDKREAGARLARIALARDYGKAIAFSGPVFRSMSIEGDTVRIHFDHAESGLVAHPLPDTYRPISTDTTVLPLVRHSPQSEVEGFAICGKDRVWRWANATIDGDGVRVRAADVTEPVAVRYAWASTPTCNLFNGDGLPACPFRTDSFPGLTEQVKYGFYTQRH